MTTNKFEPPVEDFEGRTRANFAAQAVMETFGASLTEIRPGEAIIEMDFDPRLTQQHGFLHAGVVTTVLDSACGYAAFSLMPDGAEVLTVEFKSNFTAPAIGDRFRFEGRVINAGRTLMVTEGRAYALRDGIEDKLVSSMAATMMVVKGRPDVQPPDVEDDDEDEDD
jgi:uncharacterized protein (TIGR00369 family)